MPCSNAVTNGQARTLLAVAHAPAMDSWDKANDASQAGCGTAAAHTALRYPRPKMACCAHSSTTALLRMVLQTSSDLVEQHR